MYFNPLGSGFDLIWSLFPIIFIAVFAFVIIGIIVSAVKGAAQFRHNNASPILTVECVAVAKRTNVTHHHHAGNDTMLDTTSTDYYVTFQVESGDRMELKVSGREYGMIAEGDSGKLTFQGTRYKGFVRS